MEATRLTGGEAITVGGFIVESEHGKVEMMVRGMFRVVAGAVACVCLVAGGGCGGASGGASPSSSSAGASQQSSSRQGEEKIASSLEERAKFLLDYKDKEYARSDEQTAMLQRAVDNGGVVSRADYEAAWNNYKQCLVDKGYVAPQLVTYPNGIHDLPRGDPSVRLSTEQSKKLTQDEVYCYSVYTINVNDLYNLAFANDALLTDSQQAIVDCFHKQGLMPVSYTKEQYLKEWDEYGETGDMTVFSFDPLDMGIRECQTANGMGVDYGPNDNLPTWKPFG